MINTPPETVLILAISPIVLLHQAIVVKLITPETADRFKASIFATAF